MFVSNMTQMSVRRGMYSPVFPLFQVSGDVSNEGFVVTSEANL